MGSGIAEVCARSGLDVDVFEPTVVDQNVCANGGHRPDQEADESVLDHLATPK
jgi:3-hydroxyacyl-CoA dehydrogenase